MARKLDALGLGKGGAAVNSAGLLPVPPQNSGGTLVDSMAVNHRGAKQLVLHPPGQRHQLLLRGRGQDRPCRPNQRGPLDPVVRAGTPFPPAISGSNIAAGPSKISYCILSMPGTCP